MRFQTLLSWGAAGEGPSPRPRLPLLPGRRRLEEGSTASAAAAPLPRVPVGAALPPPTCHWLRHAHHIHPRHTSHTHITHTHHSHAAHTCTYTSHAHTTALQAGRGGGGEGTDTLASILPQGCPGSQAPPCRAHRLALLPPLGRLVQAQLGWAPTRPEGLLLASRRPKPRLSAFRGQARGSR